MDDKQLRVEVAQIIRDLSVDNPSYNTPFKFGRACEALYNWITDKKVEIDG